MKMQFKDANDFLSYAASPRNLEDLGQSLAGDCRDFSTSAVVTLDNPVDSILGHVIARELGVSRTAVLVDLGRISTDALIPDGTTVILVAVLAENQAMLSAIGTYLEGLGHGVIKLTMLTDAVQEVTDGPMTIQLLR